MNPLIFAAHFAVGVLLGASIWNFAAIIRRHHRRTP